MTGSDLPDGTEHGDDDVRPSDVSSPSSSEQTESGTDRHGQASEMIRGRFAFIIIGLMVVLADFSLYHAEGFSGPATFFAGALVLLFIGIPKRSVNVTSILLTVFLLWISWRLACNGDGLMIIVGLWLLHAAVLAFRRQVPYVLETFVFAAQSVPGGYEFIAAMNERVREKVLRPVDEGRSPHLLNVGLPVFSALLFGTIFIMANPDVVNWVSGTLSRFTNAIREFLVQFSLLETGFWALVAWLTGGLLCPAVSTIGDDGKGDAAEWVSDQSPTFHAFRNTLLTVIGLFSVYLVFEFYTLWFQSIPDGFHYSGYAHQGAAWLTVALALATLMLSLIFRGLTLCDLRLPQLQRLALVWSILNFVLAIAVYHRMLIYIDFNGMTRMRVVGLLGITSVVGGFAIVLVKINLRRNFLWLIRRQLWVLAAAIFVFAVLPVDVLIHNYNVRQILSGNHAPVVQMTEHAVDNEALPVLLPLCQAQDERIRRGIQAMLEQRLIQLLDKKENADLAGWTAWQKSTNDALAMLTSAKADWQAFENSNARQAAWKSLKDFAWKNWW